MMRPAISLLEVRALNCLQNSMMLICAWPSAGPTGGAGVALPASICNLTDVCTFFGAICDLPESFFFEGASVVHALNRHPEAVVFPLKGPAFLCVAQALLPVLENLYVVTFSTCPNSNSTGVARP